MFNNIGGKIKGWAKAVCWIGIVGSVIMGIAIAVTGSSSLSTYGYYRGGVGAGDIFGGIFVAAIGALVSWVNSFLLYGFGELIDTSKAIEHKLAHMSFGNPQPQSDVKQGGSVAPGASEGWRCEKCGKFNPYGKLFCNECGAVK